MMLPIALSAMTGCATISTDVASTQTVETASITQSTCFRVSLFTIELQLVDE